MENSELLESWRLEQLGAAYFDGLAQLVGEPHATTTRLLALVERKMAAELKHILELRGCSHVDVPPEAVAEAQQKGKEAGWSGFVDSIASGSTAAISLYRRLGKTDAELAPVAERLIRHERLLVEVAQLTAAEAQQRLRLFLDSDPVGSFSESAQLNGG